MKRLTAMLAAMMLLTGTIVPALANSPMYVDGNGNVITEDAYNNAQNNENNGGSAGSTGGVIGTVDLPQDEPEEHGENTSWMYESTVLRANWRGEDCTVVALGQRVSTIRLSSGTAEVYTQDLTWETTAPAGQQLCVVNTTNPARLHKSPKDGSAIIHRCMPSTVLPVFEVKKGWVRVQYEDAVGWIKKKSVDFVSVDTSRSYHFGYVSYNGKYSRGSTVKIRRSPSSTSRALDELMTGQRVVALETVEDGKWVRIDAGSLQGYILADYLSYPTGEALAKVPRRGTTAENIYTMETPEDGAGQYVLASAGQVNDNTLMDENPLAEQSENTVQD